MKLLRNIKIILIAVIGSSLLSCNKSTPPFPEIKHHYSIIKTNKAYLCVRSDIVSFNPYIIANPVKLAFEECSDIEGYKISDAKKLYDWMRLINDWAEEQNLIKR
jgi:hypothetical protein